jgi:adenylosuccinate synthase
VEELGTAALYAGDLKSEGLKEKLHFLHQKAVQKAEAWKNCSSEKFVKELSEFDISQYEKMLAAFASKVRIIPEGAFLSIVRREDCVFEGAQGVLLDQYQGFFPNVTRSTTTTANAEILLAEAGKVGEVTRYGLLRAYGTRHGAGPFVTEAGLLVPPCDNSLGEWQGAFRLGWFDAVAARFALGHSKTDEIVLTNLDRLDGIKSLSVGIGYKGMSGRFYDPGSRQLKLISNYGESELRTRELFSAQPIYENMAGWNDQADLSQETYIKNIETLIGRPISALSRRNDSLKDYR